jgi:hypothetical protein
MIRRTIWTFALIAILCGSALTASAQMISVGDYTNQKFTTEHCVGYDVQLWKLNGQLYGVLSYCYGLTGDTPIGYIDHVVWDVKTGKLTFDAKLTTGNDGPGKDGKDVMSKDLYQFDGTLTASLLSGKMTHEDMAQSNPSPDTATVRLKLDKSMTKMMDKYPTREAWLAYYADIMASLGPKW